jgi:hypothetical protein
MRQLLRRKILKERGILHCSSFSISVRGMAVAGKAGDSDSEDAETCE